MENLAKYLRNKEQAKSGYNHTVKELLDSGAETKIQSAFIDDGVIRGRHNLFRAVRKLTFVFCDYPAKYETRKQEIVIYNDIPLHKTVSFEKMPYVNQQTLNMLVGTYIGSCFITQVVDGNEDGNIHIYLSLPHK